jgi:hypothetical protein
MKCSCCFVEGFNDTSSFGVPGGVYYDEVHKSKIMNEFWSDKENEQMYCYKYNNFEALWKTVTSLISGYQPNISIRLKLAENLIKASKI